MEIEAKLSSCGWLWSWKTCSQFLPFKQTVHDIKWDWISVRSLIACVHQHSMQMTRKLQPSSNRAIVGFIQYIHCIAVAYSVANEAQNRLLVEYHKILSTEYKLHRFTDVEAEYWCLCLLNILLPDKMIFPFEQRHQFHIYSSDVMKFILAVGANHLFFFARSQCAYPNRVTASFLAARNFLAELSHHFSWHQDDLDISGNQTLAPGSAPVQLWDTGVFIYLFIYFSCWNVIMRSNLKSGQLIKLFQSKSHSPETTLSNSSLVSSVYIAAAI